MGLPIFMKQLRRGKGRSLLYILLLTAVAAFFVMSVNLYRNSQRNLQTVEENYSTLAVMELYGDVDKFGQLTSPNSPDCVGYESVAVEGYDLSAITAANGVQSWDLRRKTAAVIQGAPAMYHEDTLMNGDDVIRFQVIGDNPIEIPILWDVEFYSSEMQELRIQITDNACSALHYPKSVKRTRELIWQNREKHLEELQHFNRCDEGDKLILYPGVEYIASIQLNRGWTLDPESGVASGDYLSFDPRSSSMETEQPVVAYGDGEYILSKNWLDSYSPMPIQRWEDVQADPQLKEHFDFLWRTAPKNLNSFTVELCNDLDLLPVKHLGGMNLAEGRAITPEEYQSGAKVCLVSQQQASLQGWELGQKLDLSFYDFEAMVSVDNQHSLVDQPYLHKGLEDFYDQGEYEIVGIYSRNPLNGNSDIASSTLALPWYTIFVPEKSVNCPSPTSKVHGALFSLKLENGSIDRFLADMETLGLTEEKDGQYNAKFSFYDQGYSLVQPGLMAMSGTAELLLILSSLLLVVTCVLLSFFFAQSQKQSVGIFRMLGGSKRQALRAVLLCALVLTVLGLLLGAVLGYQLARQVGEAIVAQNLEQSRQAAAYQAFVVKSAGQSTQVLAVEADPLLSALASGAVLLFPLLLWGFVLQYIHKEPRALLPKSTD